VKSPPTTTATEPSAERSPPENNRIVSKRRREATAAWLFVLPDVVGLGLFVALPMALGLGLALFDVSGFGGYEFVGLQNFRRLASDQLFLESVRITGIFVAGFVPLLYAASLGLALLIRAQFPGVTWCRSAFFLPHVVSLVVIGLCWQFMLIDGRGIVNVLLQQVGLTGRSWLGNPSLALGVVILVSVWFFMGFYMIVFLAGLQDIPRVYYEAARVDGASYLQTFRYITMPLLKPTSFFVIVISTIIGVSGLQAFDLVYVMTQGGPANSTSLAVFYIYQQAFQYNSIGYASAMATSLVAVLLVVTGAMFALTRGGRFDN
jgi:multiple sugar transport system permease protein